MKLNRLERHTAYIIMLAEAEKPGCFFHEETGRMRESIEHGFCWMYRMLTNSDDLYFYFRETLPELHKKSNSPDGIYLFRNWSERITALKQCIEETY